MNQPILALDYSTLTEVNQFLNHFDEALYVKVGMELYLQHGPQIIQEVKARNHRIFLDLKLHDIPTTVYKAMKGLARLDIDLINVHAAGGVEMMNAARLGLEDGAKLKRPDLIAVTQLTSTTQSQMQREQLISGTLHESVVHYALLAQKAQLDGVVCSVQEAGLISQQVGSEFYKVTPGIRLEQGQHHDQKRVATPNEARTQGSTHIVVGRAVTGAADPVAAYHQILKEWGTI